MAVFWLLEGVDPATVRFAIWDKAYNTNTLTPWWSERLWVACKESENRSSSEDGSSRSNRWKAEVRKNMKGSPNPSISWDDENTGHSSMGNELDKEFTYYESELPRLPLLYRQRSCNKMKTTMGNFNNCNGWMGRKHPERPSHLVLPLQI